MALTCEESCKIMQFNLALKDHDILNFLICFQNIFITRLSAVGKVLLERKFSNVALWKLFTAKVLKTMKDLISCSGIVKFVKRFEEIISLEKSATKWKILVGKRQISCGGENCEWFIGGIVHRNKQCLFSQSWKNIVIFHSSIWRVLHMILHLYPYKLQ